MRRWLPLLVLPLMLAACRPHRRYAAGDERLLRRARRPSWRELRQHPRGFDGDTILLRGCLHQRFEDSGLYDPGLFARQTSRVWVGGPLPAPLDTLSRADRFDQRPALIVGVFDADMTGHMGGYGGSIKPVLYIRID